MFPIQKHFLFLCGLFTIVVANATVNFTPQDLELVKGACLAGNSFEFFVEADGTISVKNIEGRGKLHVTKKSVDTVDLPDTDKKQEFNDIRSCIKGYLLQDKSENSHHSQIDKYVFTSNGVDDKMFCSLNGKDFASNEFGKGRIRIDVTDLIRKEQKNRLHCRVLDNDIGRCYAWDFELQKNGVDSLVKEKFSCCNESCRKNSEEVMDENFDFQG